MKWNDFVLTLTATSQVADNLLRLEFEVGGGTAGATCPSRRGRVHRLLLLAGRHRAERPPVRRSGRAGRLGDRGSRAQPRPPELLGARVRPRHPAHARRRGRARPRAGDRLVPRRPPGLATPRRRAPLLVRPAADASRHVLAGDLAALPALARILEETPAGVDVTVIAEVLDRTEIAYLPDRPGTEIIELIGTGNGAAPSRLPEALRAVDLPTDGYLWLAGRRPTPAPPRSTCAASGGRATAPTSSATGATTPRRGPSASRRRGGAAARRVRRGPRRGQVPGRGHRPLRAGPRGRGAVARWRRRTEPPGGAARDQPAFFAAADRVGT